MVMQKILPFIQAIDCDLVIFLYKTAEGLLDTTVLPFIRFAVCCDLLDNNNDFSMSAHSEDSSDGVYSVVKLVQHNQSTVVCSQNVLPTEIATKVQQDTAGTLVAYRIFSAIPAIFLGLLWGAWSDTRGRKLPMMVPSCGSCVAVVIYLLSAQVHGYKAWLLLAGAAVQGVCGKTSLVLMAVNSHVSDMSDAHERTARLGRLLASSFLGMFLGSLLSGILQDVSNLSTTLLVVSACHTALVLFVLLSVRNTVVSEDTKSEESVNLTSSTSGSEEARSGYSDGKRAEGKGSRQRGKKKLPPLFSWEMLKESLLTVVKKREGHKRCVIIIILTCLNFNHMLKVGDQDITVQFVQAPPLSWPMSRYGYLVATTSWMMGLTLLIILPVLTNLLHMSDTSLVLLAISFRLVRLMWAGFCTRTWMVFTSVVFGSIGGLITPALRSELSKTANPGEVGKLFSIQASLETLAKLVGSSIFATIYSLSAHILPAIAYLCEAVVLLFMLILVLCLIRVIKDDEARGLVLGVSRTYQSVSKYDDNLNGQLVSMDTSIDIPHSHDNDDNDDDDDDDDDETRRERREM